MNSIVSKQIIRFYSTPTFQINLKQNIKAKSNILNRIENKDNTYFYKSYNSYKNMYSGLPIKNIHNLKK